MKRVWNFFKYVLFLGFGLGIFFYKYPPGEFDKLWERLQEANYIYIIPVIIIALLAHYSRALRWKMLIDPLGYNTRPFSAFRSVMIGYFFNTLIPRMGEVSRCAALNRMDKIPVSASLGTVITERIFDLIALGLVVALTILLEFELVGETIIDMLTQKVEGAGGLFSWITLLVALGFALLVFIGLKLLKKIGLYDKILNLIRDFGKGILSVRKLKNPWLFIGHTLFIWLAYFVMCYLSFFTYPETADLGIRAGLVVFTLSTIGFIAPVPGGVGTYQYMFVLALTLYGIDELTMGSVAMIAFMVNTILNLIVGAITLNFSPQKLANNAPETSI